MLMVLQIIGLVLVLVLGLILLALATPLRLELRVARETHLTYSAALRPFGRFGPRIPLSGETDTKTAKPGRKKKSRRRFPHTQPKRLAKAAIRLVRDLIGQVRIEAATLDLKFGLGDPGETGQVYGQVAPLIYGTKASSRCHVTIEPLFDRAALTGRAALDLSLVPLRLIPPLARFGWVAFGPAR